MYTLSHQLGPRSPNMMQFRSYTCKQDSYALCTSQLTAPVDVTAVSYDSECEPSTLSTRIPVAWAAFMDDHIAEAPRVILIAPDQTAAGSDDDSPAGDESSTGLATEGKIAIGVVVPVLAILLAAAFWLLRRKQWFKQRGKWFSWQKSPGAELKPGASGGTDSASGKAELQGSSAAAVTGPHGVAFEKPELDHSQPGIRSTDVVTTVGEPGADPSRRGASELDAQNQRFELPS